MKKHKKSNAPPADPYKLVTDKILAMLDQGRIPWHRPWEEGGWGQTPRNAVSNRPYRGVNVLLLQGLYRDPRWLTFKQALDLGGAVRKGEKGQTVLLWKPMRWVKEADDRDGGEVVHGVLARAWTVFNVEQTDGLKLAAYEPPKTVVDPHTEAQRLVRVMPVKPTIKHDSAKAYYVPLTDVVHMPQLSQFETADGYYATLFHELGHSTGHDNRLNRHGYEGLLGPFGSAPYSKEELVAEITSAFLCAETGIRSDANLKNQVAYIQSWIAQLKNDKRLITWAASRAQDAADWVAGRYEKKRQEAAA